MTTAGPLSGDLRDALDRIHGHSAAGFRLVCLVFNTLFGLLSREHRNRGSGGGFRC